MAAARRLPSLLCVLALVASCAESSSTQVVVLMDTDYGTPGEVDRIRARVFKMVETDAGTEEVETWSNEFAVSDDAGGEAGVFELPATFGILPGDSGLNNPIVIELEALAAGTGQAVVSRRVKTGFVAGEARLVRMLLYRACAEMTCSAGESCGCPGAQSCEEPSCVDEFVRPEDLERIDDPGSLPADAGIPVQDAGLPDGGTEPDGSVPDGSVINCEPPLVLCDMDCVNPQADPRYCGDCETSCPTGNVCEGGHCIDPGDCRTNEVGCSGFTYCDESNGECLPGCAEAQQCNGENEVCDTGTHECVCAPEFHPCGAVCLSDLDVNSCGESCVPCLAPPKARPICFLGACYFVCDETYELCDQMCCPTVCPPGQALYAGACAGIHLQIADEAGTVGEFSSLALDEAGRAHIAYYAASGRDLAYAAPQADDTWLSERPDGKDEVGRYASIAFDGQGAPHVAYHNASNKDLMFASRQAGGVWTIEIVDGADDVGEYASLAFDATGAPHISYYDRSDKDLKYATRQGSAAWAVETVDDQDDVGEYTSLAIDPSGAVHISYYDADAKDLKYASRDTDGDWRIQTVASNGNVGKYSSLAFDPSGAAHISYYGEDDKDLLYASADLAGLWTSQTVEGQPNVGKYSSLAFDGAGLARISYYDESTRDLKYAVQQSIGSWSIEIVDSADDVGKYTSVAVDELGHAHVSYYDETNANLKYALVAAPLD